MCPLRGPLLKMKINEWGWVEVNIQSRSICGLICMEHGVPSWSETAVEGPWSSSYTKHPPVSPVNYSIADNIKKKKNLCLDALHNNWYVRWHCFQNLDKWKLCILKVPISFFGEGSFRLLLWIGTTYLKHTPTSHHIFIRPIIAFDVCPWVLKNGALWSATPFTQA